MCCAEQRIGHHHFQACLHYVIMLRCLCAGIAPPCVDCNIAEGITDLSAHGSLSDGSDRHLPDTPSSPPPPQTDISSQVLVASAATPRASGRYNLRSRAPGATASSDGLTKPLLAETAGAGRHESFGAHDHNGHHHSHGHSHGASGHGGHAGHVPHHHHPVPTGDLKQGVVLLVAMSVHTFLECMALGLMVGASRPCVIWLTALCTAISSLHQSTTLQLRSLRADCSVRQGLGRQHHPPGMHVRPGVLAMLMITVCHCSNSKLVIAECVCGLAGDAQGIPDAIHRHCQPQAHQWAGA